VAAQRPSSLRIHPFKFDQRDPIVTQPLWSTSPHLPAYDTIAAALRRVGLDPERHLHRMATGTVAEPNYVLSITAVDSDIDKVAALLPGEPPVNAKATTVGDLIAILSTMDRDLPVMLAKDGEGNGFETLHEVAESMCDGETTWHTPEQWAAELANPDSRFDPEDDAPPDEGEQTGDGTARRVALLWP
jgi:hypothetical protein